MCSGWSLDGVKYQEISINKITLVNVASNSPDFISKLFVKVIVRSSKTRLVGGFLN